MFEAEASVEAARSRLEAVRGRIRAACARSGREDSGVALVAVSKTVDPSRVLDLAAAGQRVFGENRVQEARGKIPQVLARWSGPPLTWRLIGHLQRNKARAAIETFGHLDSVDSLRLLDAVARGAEEAGRTVPVLLQFNCSGEASKGGLDPNEVDAVARAVRGLPGVSVTGVMTIARPADDPEQARPDFRRLRAVRDALQDAWGRALPDLSMGMSHDLEIAVEEGATLVRVGTALFGERPAPASGGVASQE